MVVMYLGRVVEWARAAEPYAWPDHPYTEAWIAEVPRVDGRRRDDVPIRGEIPSPLAPPPGCHFHPRCPRASACHLNDLPS